MNITLELSDSHEGTKAPWWMIIKPSKLIGLSANSDITGAVGMSAVVGPFFSRESAEAQLESRRYAYGDDAVVWCASGYESKPYCHAIDTAAQHDAVICEKNIGELHTNIADSSYEMFKGALKDWAEGSLTRTDELTDILDDHMDSLASSYNALLEVAQSMANQLRNYSDNELVIDKENSRSFPVNIVDGIVPIEERQKTVQASGNYLVRDVCCGVDGCGGQLYIDEEDREFTCPKCGTKMKCVNSREMSDTCRKRWYKCPKCGHRKTTYEE